MVVGTRCPGDGVVGGMSGRPEGIRAAMNDLAREWALCDEQGRADRLCELLVHAAEQELLREARARAARLVGPQHVDDVINDVWEKVLCRGAFQPARGSFAAFFHTVLHHHCIDVIRQRRRDAVPVKDEAIDWVRADSGGEADPVDSDPGALGRLADLEGRIGAAIEVLDLPPRYAGMLRLMAGPSQSQPDGETAAVAGNGSGPAAVRDAARMRQDKARLRKKIDALASLTAEEARAAGLVRKYHSVAAAAAAGDGMDEQVLRRAYAGAAAKILALFGLGSED